MMFDNMELNKLLNQQKRMISKLDTDYKEMKKKKRHNLTVEILEKLWGQEDMIWENVNKSLDEGKRIMKERNSTHQDIDQLIKNHEYIKELQHRERKQMLSKINIRNTQRRDKNKEEKGKAANENTSSSLDEGKTKTQQSVEKDATEDLAGLQCNEMTVSQEKIINKSSTEIVQSVAEGDTEQLDAPLEQLTVVDKEVHEDNVSTVTPLTASHENEGVDPPAASVVESAQMKEVSSPISINTESPVQDYQDESKEKAGENMETRKTDEMHSPIPIHSPMDIVSDDQPCSRWIDGMHSPIPIHSPVGTSTPSDRQLEIVACDIDDDIPFVKTTPFWHTIESMEVFCKLPQNPHFRPLLKGVKESAREGLAIGAMVTFSTVVDRIYRLRFEDPRSTIEDCLETLVELESNGFNVEVIRNCLTRLLLLKDKQEELEDRSKGVVEKIEEQKLQEKTIDDEVNEIERQIRQVEEKRRKVLLKKEKWNAEVDAMKTAEGAIEQKIIEVAAKFDGLAAAPL